MHNLLTYKKYLPWLFALAYALIYAVYTNPLLVHAGTLFPGITTGYGDAPVILGNAYIFDKSIADVHSVFYTNDWFYPVGTPLFMHGHTLFLSAIHWLFNADESFVVFNMLLLVFFILSGVGMARLVNTYTRQYFLSFVMGFIWAFLPYKMYQLQDHVWYVLTLSIPYYVLNFTQVFSFHGRKIRLESERHLLYSVLFLLLAFLCDYYTLFFLIYFSIFYIVIKLFNLHLKIRLLSLKTFTIFILSSVATTLLVLWFNSMGVSDNTSSVFAGDMAGYVLPLETVKFRPYLTKIEAYTGKSIGDIRESYFFTGFAFIAFCIFVFVQYLKHKKQVKYPSSLKLFLLLSVIFFLLSVPQIRFLGYHIGDNPFSLFNYIPFLNNVRVSGRYFSMFSLFGLLSISIIFSHLNFKFKKVYLAALLALLLFEYVPKQYLFIDSERVPAAIKILKEEKNSNALLPLPFGLRDGLSETGHINTMDIYYQTIHKKKLIGGYVSRLNKNIIDFYRSDTVARQLLDLQKSPENVMRLPTIEEVKNFYETFKPAYFLISPEWKQTPASRHLLVVLQYFNYEILWEKDYLLYKIYGMKVI